MADPNPKDQSLSQFSPPSKIIIIEAGQPRPQEGIANPNPEGRPHTKKEEPTPTLRRANLFPREERASPEGRADRNPNGRPQPQGPIPVLFSPTLGDNYHCVIVISILIITTQSWTTATPRRKGQPRLQGGRANPTSSPRRANPSPRKKSNPYPREGRACLSKFVLKNYNHEPSHPSQRGRVQPHPLLLDRAWPPPSFPFGWALAFPFPSFRSGPDQPRPEVPTLTPRKKADPYPRVIGPTQTQGGRAKFPSPRKKNQKKKKSTDQKQKNKNM